MKNLCAQAEGLAAPTGPCCPPPRIPNRHGCVHAPAGSSTTRGPGCTVEGVEDSTRIELTFRLWGTGAPDAFDDYVDQLIGLLPRNKGVLERRASEVDAGPGAPDALLVMSFPDSASVDGFLRDPLRIDMEDLASVAIIRSLITDSRHRAGPGDDHDAEIVPFPPDGDE